MDMEQFLQLERQRLAEERQRLIASNAFTNASEQTLAVANETRPEQCPALQYLTDGNYQAVPCKRLQAYGYSFDTDEHEKAQSEIINSIKGTLVMSSNDTRATTSSFLATTNDKQQQFQLEDSKRTKENATTPTTTTTKTTFCLFTQGAPEYETENASTLRSNNNNNNNIDNVTDELRSMSAIVELPCAGELLTKHAKELVNRKELQAGNPKDHNVLQENKMQRHKVERKNNQDDMEQWVSDTFYSYFPGYNNENQKRQHYLRERQRENQANLLKHQMLHPIAKRKHVTNAKSNNNNNNIHNNNHNNNEQTILTARSSSNNSTASRHTNATDKTDLEIIVNNPDYTPSKHGVRPGTTRHKLLQDLRHTELSHIVAGDAVSERNRRNAELESARKKDYQRELMQQIEEKRRSIELLREKERRQEEVLTRRLQEQLKTIQLEEQLEKEKLRSEKLRFDTEQNRFMREHLLAKLEQDAKLLCAKDSSKSVAKAKATTDAKDTAVDTARTNDTSSTNNSSNNNKVYKYFSNSARHEYRRGQPMPAEVEFDLEIPELSSALHTERECFHLSEKLCPMCDAPLRNYESSCLRCQRELTLKLHATEAEAQKLTEQMHALPDEEQEKSSAAATGKSFALVCVKCERLYTLCPSCLAKSDVCRACHRKRNVCMNCRRTLCSFCLDEVACGRDTERMHINEQPEVELQADPVSSGHVNAGAFQVLQESETGSEAETPLEKRATSINYTQIHNNLRNAPVNNESNNSNSDNNNNNNFSNNNSNSDSNRLPYSMHIERNSIFHPDYAFTTLPKIIDKQLSFDLDSSATDELQSMERVRRETDKRLTRYLKNYGDLTITARSRSKIESRNRGTQTTPEGVARRDIVLHEEHNLSMPLLREMPKMTRNGAEVCQQRPTTQKQMENLEYRWQVPAVQKYSISATSPKVLTQVGAIRKQMQASSLLSNARDEGV